MTREDEINNASYAYWANNYANIEFIDEEEKELHSRDIQDSFINGAEWADSHPHWISVDDKLPKKDGKYLFYDEILGVQASIYYDGCALTNSITHWMPLPQRPKEGGKQ